MTASVNAQSTGAGHPNIPFYWWLKAHRAQAGGADKSVYIPDHQYVPSSTADLWKRC